MRNRALGLAILMLLSCGEGRRDPALDGLAVQDIGPGLVLPGTELWVRGASFVDAPWGEATLALRDGDTTVRTPAKVESGQRLVASLSREQLQQLGMGPRTVTVQVEIASALDGEVYVSPPRQFSLTFAEHLKPRLAELDVPTVVFPNEQIRVVGENLLRGDGEGRTEAWVEGCFVPEGKAECVDFGPMRLPLNRVSDDRKEAVWELDPRLTGIKRGEISMVVVLINVHADDVEKESREKRAAVSQETPRMFDYAPDGLSLAQHLFLDGAGFVRPEQGGATLLELSNTKLKRRGASLLELGSVSLVPEVLSGRELRYTLHEDDVLARLFDVRRGGATLTANATPLVLFGNEEVRGPTVPISLEILPVKQVVHIVFQPSYVESLRHFGLRAMDRHIRQRAIEVILRDYATINLEVRTEKPTDFAHYAQLEVMGPDPNGVNLLGYDNTPGKDRGNRRLFDRIGGFNARTQRDNFPGYGGVFLNQMFSFSLHPGALARRSSIASHRFDDIFDPLRPDRGGAPVRAEDLEGAPFVGRQTGEGCPGDTREEQISCGVWVLGNLIGTTASHELGHSLGLANPKGSGFHNAGDEPNRLMDSLVHRPFAERAEIDGQGPARICDREYEYLRDIMPGPEPEDRSARPPCFSSPAGSNLTKQTR